MKVVFVTDQVYLHGGLERVLINRMNLLCKQDSLDVFLITSQQYARPPCYEMSSAITHFDIEIDYNRSKSYFSFENITKLPKHFLKLKRVLRKIKPSTLVLSNFGFDFYFLPFSFRKIKKIKEFHSSRYYYTKELLDSSFFKKMIHKLNVNIEKRYDKLVVLNEDEKQYYPFKNLKVIPNFISLNKPKPFERVERKKIIIAAGRIAPVKQFSHLIEAWNLIENKFSDWEVHIYGDGDNQLSSELQNLINQYNLKNIFLKGTTLSLNKKMKEASIFALTSLTECFPMVLLEALANGLPVISYDCPHGPRNIVINGGDGVLVEHNNIQAFASELSKLISNIPKRERMAQNGAENVKRFNEKVIIKQWLTLFNSNND